APLVTNQVEFHPYLDQSKVVAATQTAGMCLSAYSPMAEGKVLHEPLLQDIATRHGKTAAQVALRWVIQQGHVVLSKTLSEQRADANLAIFDFELPPEEMAAIGALARPDGRTISPERLAPEWD
ncbi:MAG: aldo/keto reductase, partial [Burkholderiaceae bacterium]|nr:aldo/keto reductase [Burkholderiaceae bacterium]